MKIQITIILGIILAISLVSAVEVFAGESYSFESPEFEYWDVVGNSSSMEGMEISWENGNTTISFDIAYKPDNFTLILFDKETEVIVEHHYSSGGSSGTKTIYKDRNITVEKPVDKIIYQDKEVEKEVEKIVKVLANKKLVWALGILVILIIICSYMGIRWERNKNKPFKGFENLEGGG